MRVVTWNVNSLKARLARVEDWITQRDPDVLVMQETKLSDDAFPTETFTALGYESAHHGNGRWNGVAIVSRVGLDQVRAGFHDDVADSIEECRIVSAQCGPIRVFSVYVPNGREVDSEHYLAKINWLGRLADELKQTCDPASNIAVCGDFNIAPEDRDVYDITQFVGQTHVTERERAALGVVLDFGLTDALRVVHPDEVGPFSWWDYRAGAFHKGWGMRIDHEFVSGPLADSIKDAWVDRDARKGKLPSDHAPVIVEYDV